MKSYEETIASVFAKGDAILESKKIRASRIRRITLAVSGACAAAAVGLFAVYSTTAKDTDSLSGYSDSAVSVTEPVTAVTTASGAGEDIITHTDSSHTTAAAYTTAAVTLSAAAQNGITAATVTASSANADSSSSGGKTPAVSGGTSQKPITTDASAITSDDEGSLEMKKIAAFATAFLAGLANTPLKADAGYNYRMYDFAQNEKGVIVQIANGKNDIDIDGNGVFDINDCYQLYAYSDGYVVDDAIKEKIERECDYDHDGTIFPFTDAYLLMKYYIISNPLDTSIFDASRYEPLESTPEVIAEKEAERAYCEEHGWEYKEEEPVYTSSMYFASNLKYLMRIYGTGYGFMADKVNSGEASLDVNDDGVFDIRDCIDYEIFIENLLYNDPKLFERYGDTLVKGVVNWNQDGLFYYTDNSIQGYDSYSPCEFDIIELPEKTIERCADLFDKVSETSSKYSGRYMAYCYLLENPADSAYYTKEYYENFYPGAVNYDINISFIFASRTMENVAYVDSFDKDKFASDFKQYCQNIEDGKRTAPDINFDGKIDSFDYNDAMSYLNVMFFPVLGETDEEFEENMPVSKKTWDYLAKDCDIDGNGKSGETYDIILMQCYMLLDNDDVFNESADDEINISEEFHSNLSLLNAIDIDRSGDANLDGNMDLADAILIMQANANPNKYEMTGKGRFNADVDDTGNGITLNDANHIQMVLVGLAE